MSGKRVRPGKCLRQQGRAAAVMNLGLGRDLRGLARRGQETVNVDDSKVALGRTQLRSCI